VSIRETSPEADRDDPPGRRPLAFGAGDFVGALAARLERSFARAGDEDTLVVGIYGAWGSGKTTVLRALEERFEAAAEETSEKAARPEPDSEAGSGAGDTTKALTLPVLFNAWRYEREEHLIVPLLKTAEKVVLRWHDDHASRSKRAWDWLAARGKLLADAALVPYLKGMRTGSGASRSSTATTSSAPETTASASGISRAFAAWPGG